MTAARTEKLTKAMLEQLAIDETCAEPEGCGALPGHKCVNKSGDHAELAHPHAVRVATAKASAESTAGIDEVAAALQEAANEGGAEAGSTEGSAPAGDAAETKPERERKPLAPACVKCGRPFPKPRRRDHCQTEAACAKRQAQNAAAAAAPAES